MYIQISLIFIIQYIKPKQSIDYSIWHW